MPMTRWSAAACLLTLLVFTIPMAHGGILRADKALLLCHRTANRDLPENTLESLALAARMGCNIVEVDVRRTVDGVLVLNHDGFLDRFTDTTGEVENTEFARARSNGFRSLDGPSLRWNAHCSFWKCASIGT